jgi:hypothetical protein
MRCPKPQRIIGYRNWCRRETYSEKSGLFPDDRKRRCIFNSYYYRPPNNNADRWHSGDWSTIIFLGWDYCCFRPMESHQHQYGSLLCS